VLDLCGGRSSGRDHFLCKQGVRRSATGSHVRSPNGDVVRDTWFLRSSWLRSLTGYATLRSLTGYATPEVDDLLGRVAAELDAGRPAGPLIKNATLRGMYRGMHISGGYDIDAVDWFFDQLLRRPDHTELAGISAGPWRDLAVAQLTRGKVRDAAEQPRNCILSLLQALWKVIASRGCCWLRLESETHASKIGYVVAAGHRNCRAALVADEDGVNGLEFGVALGLLPRL